jgi:GcrA cell cycle regulator
MGFWDDERIERLKKEWAEGGTASSIGNRMGCSRNAIIGKVHRLDLPDRGRLSNRVYGKKGTRSRSPKSTPHKAFVISPQKLALHKAMAANAEPLPPRSETDIARVSFADMEPSKHCRFIPGDPGDNFKSDKPMYCGDKPVLGQAYCEVHLRRCHGTPLVMPEKNYTNNVLPQVAAKQSGFVVDTRELEIVT